MAIEKKIVIDVDAVKAAGGIDKLTESLKETNKEVKNTSASTQQMSSTVDKATGGAVSKFKALKGTLKTVIGGFKSLRIAIIGTGIGALLIAITSLTQAFTRSEEGQNKFAKILGVIGSVTGNLLDLIADLGEGIISVFENPKQALINFKNLLVENITNRFKAILDTVGFLGSAIKNVFSGEFKAALDDAKKAGSSFVDSFTGVENSIDKATNAVKEFGKEIAADASAAAKIADQRAQAEKLARNLVVERAEAERKIAELREKAVNKDKFTAQERIKFLEEAGKVSDELAAKEIAVSQLRLEAKRTENALTKSNKEDLDEQARLEAEVIQKETQRLNLQKRLSTELLTSRREVTAQEKSDAKELADLKKTLRDAEAVSEQEKRDLELIKIQEHYDNLIAQAEANNIKTDELEAARDEAKKLKQEEFDLKDAERKQKKLEEDKKITDAEIALEQQKTAAKQKALDDAISLAGAETGVGKALLIVKQGLALKEMIMEAKKTLTFSKLAVAKSTVASAEGTAQTAKIGFPQNIPMLIGYAAQAAGIIGAIKSATSSASSVASSFGGGGGASTPAAASQPPSFNVVGATETSQLAEAVGGQAQQPVQAYVVANDVTTAQSLENNIVEGATL
jgi:hypothetical protein